MLFPMLSEMSFQRLLEKAFPNLLEKPFPRFLEKPFPRLFGKPFSKPLEKAFPKLFTKVPDKEQQQEQQQASKSFLRPRYTTLLAVKNSTIHISHAPFVKYLNFFYSECVTFSCDCDPFLRRVLKKLLHKKMPNAYMNYV